jgi:hypothetical protein
MMTNEGQQEQVNTDADKGTVTNEDRHCTRVMDEDDEGDE